MIWVLAYVGGFVICLYPLTQFMAAAMDIERDDSMSLVFAVALAVIVGFFWPGVVLCVGAWKLSKLIWVRAPRVDLAKKDSR